MRLRARLEPAIDGFRVFKPALHGQRLRIAGALALSMLTAALELLRPWPLKLVFDRVLVPDGPQGGLAGQSPRVSLAIAAAGVLCISLGLGIVSERSTLLLATVGKKAATRVRRRVFEHLHRLAIPFHMSSRTGDLLVRLMGDVNMVRDLLFASWVSLMERGVLLAATAVVMFVLDPVLAVVALLPLPLLGVKLTRSTRRLKDVTRKQRRREGDAAAFAAETLRQIRVVKAYAREDTTTEEFASRTSASEKAGMKAVRITARMSRVAESLTGAGVAIVLFVGALQVLGGRLTPGGLLVFMSYVRAVYKPLRKLSNEGGRLGKAAACAGRLREVLDVPAEPGGGVPAPRFRGRVTFENVSFTYQSGARALDSLSLDVEPGSLVVLSGENGSGKSTALSLLLRLLEPGSGQVLVDDWTVGQFDLESYRRRFAYVPQETQLFGASIRDNILYGRPDAADDEVEDAARAALVHDVVQRLPDGYDTVLDEDGASLSGGEGRRLMLARAALRDARILLLDEPLAGLDPQARRHVAEAVRQIAAGRTTIVVSHGPANELRPDVVVQLTQGRVDRVLRRRRDPDVVAVR